MNPRILVITTILLWTLGGTLLKLISTSNTFTIMSIGLLASTIFFYIILQRAGGFDRSKLTFKNVMFSLLGYFSTGFSSYYVSNITKDKLVFP